MECKNYVHKYKCDHYIENPENCKTCELRVKNEIEKVYIVMYSISGTNLIHDICATGEVAEQVKEKFEKENADIGIKAWVVDYIVTTKVEED